MMNPAKFLCVFAAVFTLQGCGDQHDFFEAPSSKSSNEYVLPAGKSVIAFSSISTARLAAPISGIDFTFVLPPGMSVATPNGLSGKIDDEAVQPGAGMAGTNLAFGSYSASTRKVYLGMATTSDTYRGGEFLRLVCNVDPGTNVTLGNLRALNNPVVMEKAVGFDSTTNSTVLLTGSLKVLIEQVR